MDVKSLDKEYIASTYNRFPVEIVGGNGAEVIDSENKKYIDLGSGIAVNTFGLCDKEWINAVSEQLNKFQHTSNLYYHYPCAKLAEMLCERTELKKVFFSNSGAEANETAIKAARKYGAEISKKSPVIITLENSFHGRTLTTLAATGQEVFHKDFLPLTDGFVSVPANDLFTLLVAVKKHNPCAVMLEIVQGEGGVNTLNKEYLLEVYSLCQREDILLICDEVQTGNGRTGELYGFMNFDIMPDVVTTAKGLGGGLPIGATMLGEKVMDIFTPGSNGSTFGGNPVVCAGAISILERLNKEFLDTVKEKSKYIFDELSNADGILSVSGLGLMIGVETKKPAAEVLAKCRENGVLVLTAKNKIRLLPPLNITKEQLEFSINVIKKACKE